MNLRELESFKLSDAVKFHNDLNPALFDGDTMRPEVRDHLLLIAEDFIEHLGISNIDVKDVTVSGSNAAYSYTPHSDIDLHIIVDMDKLSNDEVYRELFNAKKTVYNDTHDITVGGYDVELYVQDSNEPHVSLGEYSVLHNDWIKIPSKRRANFDQSATRMKYEKLGSLAELVLQTRDLDKLDSVLETIRKYRKAGLDMHGEFGPENLAYKALRTNGLIQDLFDLKHELHSDQFTMENSKVLDKVTLSPSQVMKKHNMTKDELIQELKRGIKVELEHTGDPKVAKEIALDHLGEAPNYYQLLTQLQLECASGYIPSNAQKNDPRYSSALTVDVKPNTLKKNAKKMGLGKISRAGIPPIASPSGRI